MPPTPEQSRAVNRLDDNLCVVAGAGTGKTTVLVERFLRLLSEPDVLPDHLAAITFTEKAAAQMKDRVRHECNRRLRDAATQRERQFWQARCNGLAATFIGTFHAFCAALVRQYPVEARVDPRFTVLAEGQQRLLMTQTVREALRRLGELDDADLSTAASSYGLRALTEILEYALTRRARLLAALATVPPDARIDDQVRIIHKLAAELLAGRITALLGDGSFKKAADFLASVHGSAGDLRETARETAVEGIALLRAARSPGKQLQALRVLDQVRLTGGAAKNWASRELMEEVKAHLDTVRCVARQALAECQLSDPAKWPDECRLIRSINRVAQETFNDFQAAKDRMGALDFDDLLLKARNLLKDHPAVRKRLAERCRQILVDELQDTDELQIQIVNLLAGDGASQGFSPRPGTFFGVGDVKQSIYRFRGADVTVFRQVAAQLGTQQTVPLTLTFRFHQGLAGLTNALFERTMGKDFVALKANREECPPVSAELLLADTAADKVDAEERLASEAALVAQRIRRLADDEGVRYGDVALLMHRGTKAYHYEDSLRRLGIPFYVVSGRRFYEQQEVRDVVTALEVLAAPSDDLPLAALLRSPFFGLSDEALFHLSAEADLAEALHQPETLQKLSPADADKARRAARWLDYYRQRAGRVSAATLVHELIFGSPSASRPSDFNFGIAAVYLPQFLGEQRYANLRRLDNIAVEFDRAGMARLEDLLEWFRRSLDEGVEEAEAPLAEERGNAVLLMTVHKAKGLEFPYVFLVNADAARDKRSEPLYPADGFGLVPRKADRRVDAEESALYSILKRDDQRLELEEFRRLFYVGATRAKERLFITGSTTCGANSWLAELLSALDIELPASGKSVQVEVTPGSRVLICVEKAKPLTRPAKRSKDRNRELFRDGLVDSPRVSKLLDKHSHSREVARLVSRVKAVDEDVVRLRLAVTSLTDYERCPALFYYRHVLRMPELPGIGRASEADARFARSVGTVVHEYLRTADFSQPGIDETRLRSIVARAADLLEPHSQRVQTDALKILDGFQRTELAAEIAQAECVLRETPFVLALDGVALTGIIDILYKTSGAEWTLVDYKTDRIPPEQASECSKQYKTQLAIYASAAERFLGVQLQKTCLAYLRAGIIYNVDRVSTMGPVRQLVSGIKSKSFELSQQCRTPCTYAKLCGHAANRR